MNNKTILNWFKNNWLLIVLVCAVGATIFIVWRQFSFNTSVYEELNTKYNEQSESFKKQINDIEAVNKKWQENQKLLNEEYGKELKSIREEYTTQIAAIARKQRKDQITIVEETKKDPKILPKKIKETFGIPIEATEGQ